jgi:uncharacterized protein (DUF1330 family)
VRVTVYAIAALKFTDRNGYDRRQVAFREVLPRHSGTVLAADDAPQVVLMTVQAPSRRAP